MDADKIFGKQKNDLGLKALGQGKKTTYKYDKPDKGLLETFDNKYPGNGFVVEFATSPNDPFSSLCPITSQADFAQLSIRYVPNVKMIESKSLKLYLFSYRNHGAFAEAVTNQIMNDLVEKLQPRHMVVESRFASRGGLGIHTVAEYKEGLKFGQSSNSKTP